MPVFNAVRWFDATLESLRQQTFADFELVISDNASEDATADICMRHAEADTRVRYLRQSHNIGANRNYLSVLAHARAPYFKWAAASDLCAPEFLAACVDELDRQPEAVLAFPQTGLFVDSLADATAYDHESPSNRRRRWRASST